MFEQESYDKATVQAASRPVELFKRYEIKNWEFSPLIYKILAASAVLHIAVLAFIAQTDVLTMRGCDSPWVGRVCQVVDMTYVGALLFGTEREYADVAYERTELGPEDEVTFIDVTGVAPLSYPEGYFQIANPVQFQMQQQMANGMDNGIVASGIPPSAFTPLPNNDSDLLKQRANPPAPNPNAFSDDPSTSLFKVDDNPSTAGRVRTRKGGRPGRPSGLNTDPKSPDETQANANANIPRITPEATPAQPTDEAKQDQWGIFINKRPMKDRGTETLARIAEKQIKLDKPFKVVIEGTLGLGKDGKTTVLKNPKPVPVDPNIPNDPEMVKLAQEWILAVGDAGWYAYLDRLDDKNKAQSSKVVITVEQTDTEFIANVRSEKSSENMAKVAASGLGLLLQGAAAVANGDDQTFLKAAAAPTSEGKTLVLTFKLPKPLVQELIQRKLAESKEPKAEPNSTAVNSGKSTTAAK